jgi:glycogen synthase
VILFPFSSTVSPTYLQQTLCSGWLASTLIRNRDKYCGILNGIDTTMWNPATDVFLPAKFSAHKTEGKEICKLFVQRGLGLASEDTRAGNTVSRTTGKVPLVVCITRLVAQKGLHLITHAIKHVEELVSLLPRFYAHNLSPFVCLWLNINTRHNWDTLYDSIYLWMIVVVITAL